MSIIKHAIISAAGMGTRIGLNMPKCLLKFSSIKTPLKNEIELYPKSLCKRKKNFF